MLLRNNFDLRKTNYTILPIILLGSASQKKKKKKTLEPHLGYKSFPLRKEVKFWKEAYIPIWSRESLLTPWLIAVRILIAT